jgi:alanine dehydrogenase
MEAVRDAFKALAKGEAQMPAKSYLSFERYQGDLRTMPAYVPTFPYATVKMVNAHPNNPKRHGLPTVMAMIAAINPTNGKPVAVLDGTEITAQRTAAAGAIATDRLAPETVNTLGFLGTGEQARYQFQAHQLIRQFKRILLYDRDPDSSNAFKQWLIDQDPSLTVTTCATPESLVADSDVIISLTPSEKPLINFERGLLKESVHINAMGADAPAKQEWPDDVLDECTLIIDHWEQASHSGEISKRIENKKLTREDIGLTLGETLIKKQKISEKKTLFDSTGLAVQDTAGANAFLQQSIEPDTKFDFLSLNSDD